MKQILELLNQSLKTSNIYNKTELRDMLLATLANEKVDWIADYPVALVHDKAESIQTLSRNELSHVIPRDLIRSVDLMAVTKEVSSLTFTAKRSHDFWKRLSSVEHIKAMISLLCVSSEMCQDDFIESSLKSSNKRQWSVETQLRDAMRANKENRDLGEKPFIVLMCKEVVNEKEDHLKGLLEHYFAKDVQIIKSKDGTVNYYLAYNEHMGEIGMRYFYRFAS